MGTDQRLAAVRIGDRYRVDAIIADGGMGRVCRVFDEAKGHTVALKMLLTDEDSAGGSTSQRQAMLEREFYLLRELHHPHIIEVFEYGVDALGAYYTMELLQERALPDRGQLPWREVCTVLRDVASALAVLHARRLVHRDIKGGNLCRAADGCIKLIDFGGMVPMGVPDELIGTPPLMAPELLQRRALDGRVDLYALGALAYRLLTGRHAYPARTMGALPRIWEAPPPRPEALVSDIPVALGDVVMSLLSLERSARPPHAGLVIEQVSVLGGLPAEGGAQEGQAYLLTPRMVGRQDGVELAQKELAKLREGRGAIVLAEGARGTGRSRFIDTCLVHAQLAGALVVRARPPGAQSQPFAVARMLVEQLLSARPQLARQAAQSHRARLEALVPALAEGGEPGDSSAALSRAVEDRPLTIASLCDFWLAAARHTPVALAIDDMDRMDEASAAMIASLAQRRTKRALALVVSAEPTAERAADPLTSLRRQAVVIELQALSAAQTAELVASVFGDADHLAAHVHWVHSVSGGLPWVQMQLLEHMVSRGIARYRAGSWSLSALPQDDALPGSLSDALRARLEQLPEPARELALTLGLLTRPIGLSLRACGLLMPPGAGPSDLTSAFGDLLAAGMVEPRADTWPFASPAWANIAANGHETDDAVLRERHRRLARATAHDGRNEESAGHHLRAGDAQAAVDTLLAHLRADRVARFDHGTMQVVEDVLLAASALAIAGEDLRFLTLSVVSMAQVLVDSSMFQRHASALLAALEQDCGLADYRELADVSDPGERLRLSFERAAARHAAARREDRGLSPFEALPAFIQMCGNFAGVATTQMDLSLCERVPSLQPYVVLSPAVGLVAALVDATTELVAGRMLAGAAGYRELLRRMAEPDRAGLTDTAYHGISRAVTSAAAVADACLGRSEALGHADALGAFPGHRTNAEMIRMAYYLMRGEAKQARRHRLRGQQMELQEGSSRYYPGAATRVLGTVFAWSDDLLSLKALSLRIEDLAQGHRGLAVVHAFCLAHYDRVRRDYQGALQGLDSHLQYVTAGRHLMWCWLAAGRVQVLLESGQAEAAVAQGQADFAACAAHGLRVGSIAVGTWFGRALLQCGQIAEARAISEQLLSEAQACGVQGILAAGVHELRARTAATAGDLPSAEDAFVACKDAHGLDPSAAQGAVLARLLLMVRERSASVADEAVINANDDEEDRVSTLLRRTSARLRAQATEGAEYDAVLSTLLQEMDAKVGFLFCLRNGELHPLSAQPASQPPAGLAEWLAEDLFDDDMPTMTEMQTSPTSMLTDPNSIAFETTDGATFRAVVLASDTDGTAAAGGIAAVQAGPSGLRTPPRQFVALLAEVLLARADADPLTGLA